MRMSERSLTFVPVALVMAILSLFPSGCSQRDQLQPKQSNVFLVSESREIAIGNEVAKEVEREYPLYTNSDLTNYVDQIGQTLAKNSDRPPRGDLKYTFKVLDSPIANAFATPGGHIYITRGIIGVLDSESELAGVIGHEIGHVASKHSAKRIQNGTLAQIGMIFAVVLAGDKMNTDLYRAVDMTATLIFLGYSRSDEDQADILGAKYLYRTGYDPAGMVGAMEGLLELQTRNPMKAEQYFQSHPLTRDRIEHIRSWLPRIPKEDVWGGVPPRTNLIGAETFKRIAAPHAQYAGGDEMAATIENLRVAINRKQIDLAAKSISDEYKDENGRSKKDYLSDLQNLFAKVATISYKVEEVTTEASREGGAARYKYELKAVFPDGRNQLERGRTYVEFKKPMPQVWKISALRTVIE